MSRRMTKRERKYHKRKARWKEIYRWAMGPQDMRQFSDYITLDSTSASVPLHILERAKTIFKQQQK